MNHTPPTLPPPNLQLLAHRLIINLIMFSQSCSLITLILLCGQTDWGLVSSGTGEQRQSLSICTAYTLINLKLNHLFFSRFNIRIVGVSDINFQPYVLHSEHRKTWDWVIVSASSNSYRWSCCYPSHVVLCIKKPKNSYWEEQVCFTCLMKLRENIWLWDADRLLKVMLYDFKWLMRRSD